MAESPAQPITAFNCPLPYAWCGISYSLYPDRTYKQPPPAHINYLKHISTWFYNDIITSRVQQTFRTVLTSSEITGWFSGKFMGYGNRSWQPEHLGKEKYSDADKNMDRFFAPDWSLASADGRCWSDTLPSCKRSLSSILPTKRGCIS